MTRINFFLSIFLIALITLFLGCFEGWGESLIFQDSPNYKTADDLIRAGEEISLRLPFPDGTACLVTQGYHSGYAIDFDMKTGDEVLATADGVVVSVDDYEIISGCDGTMDSKQQPGRFVKLKHSGKNYEWTSSYYHLNSRTVNLDDKVKQGQKVGEAGNTGYSCGDHLHFEMRRYSKGSDCKSGSYESAYSLPMKGVDKTTGENLTSFIKGRSYHASTILTPRSFNLYSPLKENWKIIKGYGSGESGNPKHEDDKWERYAIDLVKTQGETEGASVYAAHNGEVIKVITKDSDSKNYGFFGNMVILQHASEPYVTFYGSLEGDTIQVSVGDLVSAQKKIGTIGCTSPGCITPHLHFTLIKYTEGDYDFSKIISSVLPEPSLCPDGTKNEGLVVGNEYCGMEAPNIKYSSAEMAGFRAQPNTNEIEFILKSKDAKFGDEIKKDLHKIFLQALAIPNEKHWISLEAFSNNDDARVGQVNLPSPIEQTDMADAMLKADLTMKFEESRIIEYGIVWINVLLKSSYWDDLKSISWYPPSASISLTIVPKHLVNTRVDSEGYAIFIEGVSLDVKVEWLKKPDLSYAADMYEHIDSETKKDLLDKFKFEIQEIMDKHREDLILKINSDNADADPQYKRLKQVYSTIVFAQFYKGLVVDNPTFYYPYSDLIDSEDLTNITMDIPFNREYWNKQAYQLVRTLPEMACWSEELKKYIPMELKYIEISDYFEGYAWEVPDSAAFAVQGIKGFEYGLLGGVSFQESNYQIDGSFTAMQEDIFDKTLNNHESVQYGDYVYSSGGTLKAEGIPELQILKISSNARAFLANSGSATISIWNSGVGTMNWTATTDASWITIENLSGADDGTLHVNYSANTGPERTATITVTADGALNSPQTIKVTQVSSDYRIDNIYGQKLVSSDGVGLGSSVSISGDYAILGAVADNVNGESSGSAYIFKRDGDKWIEQIKLIPSDGEIRDLFGRSVSISGDYAIVGASENIFANSPGAAYIFKRDGDTWVEQAKLLSSDGAKGDRFGVSVSISGDYAIVGAWANIVDNHPSAGSVYIFKRERDTWLEQERLLGSYRNCFGWSVSISGAYVISDQACGKGGDIFKRDGEAWKHTKLLDFKISSVSISDSYAIFETYGNDNNESVYIYKREGESWSEQIKLSLPGPVSISEDYAIVGSYLFKRAPEEPGWIKQAKLPMSGSASISGDYAIVGTSIYNLPLTHSPIIALSPSTKTILPDSGGFSFIISNTGNEITRMNWTATTDSSWIAIENSSGTDDATLYVNYSGNTGSERTATITVTAEGALNSPQTIKVTQVISDYRIDNIHGQKLVSSDGVGLGSSVSISGDYAIFGDSADNVNGNNSGSAYIFKRDEDTWVEQAKLLASDGAASDKFGCSVSLSGDYAIVGAYDSGSSGSAYIFRRDEDVWVEQVKLLPSYVGGNGENFGFSVFISGDYAIVGFDETIGEIGSAYIFKRDGESWTEQVKLRPSDVKFMDKFGQSVSISGDYAIVGACWDGSYDLGSAYIFKRDGNRWIKQVKLLASDGDAFDSFGSSVSISGDYAVIGARGNGLGPGSAYIFKREGEKWLEQIKFSVSKPLSISEDYAIVGSYLFKRTSEEPGWIKQAKLPTSGPASISGDYAIVGTSIYNLLFTHSPVLSLSSNAETISKDSGELFFDISNTGNRMTRMNWTATTKFSWIAIQNSSGTDDATLSINYSDNTGPERTATITVTADGALNSPQVFTIKQKANNKPVATAKSVSVDEDGSVAVIFSGSDIEGDALTYEIVTGPKHGKYVDGKYSPNANYNGTDSFIYKANDGKLDSNLATVTITVNPLNDAPVAAPKLISVNEDGKVNVPFSGSDIDGNALTYSIVSNPKYGKVSGKAPNISYSPNANYNGTDSFTYKANDGKLDSNIATVTITVNPVNDAPVAAPKLISVNEDGKVNVPFSGSDIDEDALTYEVVAGPEHGIISGTEYKPSTNYNGTDSFTYKANDGKLDSNVATVTITVNPVNDTPVAEDQLITIDENQELEIILVGSDADGDPIRYNIGIQPLHGKLSGVAPGLVYTPEDYYYGPDRFSFIVDDGNSNSDTGYINITISPANEYSLNLLTYGNGSIIIDGHEILLSYDELIDRNEEVVIKAVPDPGYSFSHWSGDITGSDNPSTISMDKHRIITAHFVELIPIWETSIRVEREVEGSEVREESSVTIGMVSEPYRNAYVSPVTKHSCDIMLYNSEWVEFSEDIQAEGKDINHWILAIDPHGNVGSSIVTTTATVSWEPLGFSEEYHYQLREGGGNSGEILISDMKKITQLEVKGNSYQGFSIICFKKISGDVNRDSIVDLKDLQACQQVLTGMAPSPFYVEAVDFNGNGKLDTGEQSTILRMISGQISTTVSGETLPLQVDIDGDGVVGLTDIEELNRYIEISMLKGIPIPDTLFNVADLNKDEVVDEQDLRMIFDLMYE